MQLKDVNKLLDLAKANTGSDYKTAQLIMATRQNLSNWRHGKPMPAGDIALVAALAGLDPMAWTVQAITENYAGTEKGEALEKILRGTRPRTRSEYNERYGDRRKTADSARNPRSEKGSMRPKGLTPKGRP